MTKWFKKCFSEYYSEIEKERADTETDSRKTTDAEYCDSEYGRIYMIETYRIKPNRSQPRKNFEDDAILSLADSIKRYGMLQPLTIRAFDSDSSDFELVAGERRLRAAGILGLTEVPCIIITASDEQSATLAIIENIQRENLNMFETAEAIASLIDLHGMTQERIARDLSMSQSYVANKLRILRLGEDERALIIDNKLSERHARALIKIENMKLRKQALDYIIDKHLNVTASEEYIDGVLANEKDKKTRVKRKFVIKDIRIFYNTIDKAIATVHKAGIGIVKDEVESESEVQLIIRIPKIQNIKKGNDKASISLNS